MFIKSIEAKIIPATNQAKTISVALKVKGKRFEASVPFGVSAGKREAAQLPLKQVLKNIERIIAPEIIGKNFKNQTQLDNFLIKLDGTSNKKRLGANGILPLSIAFLRALAFENKEPLWQYIAFIAKTKPSLPTPAVLLLEGGKHGKGKLSFQEFLLLPNGETFKEKFALSKKIENKLKNLLLKEGVMPKIERGAEGAFIPDIIEEQALFLLEKAINKAEAKLGIDVAATSLLKGKNYLLNKNVYSAKTLRQFYFSLLKKFPFIIALEDPFSENNFASWKNFRKLLRKEEAEIGQNGRRKEVIVMGDDLTTTNIKQIKEANAKGLCNGVIIKPNQIGSVSETISAALLAKKYKWQIIVSHRARETEDDFIADLSAGLGADYIKAGGFGQKERLAKYKRLLAIEKEMLYNTNTKKPLK